MPPNSLATLKLAVVRSSMLRDELDDEVAQHPTRLGDDFDELYQRRGQAEDSFQRACEDLAMYVVLID